MSSEEEDRKDTDYNILKQLDVLIDEAVQIYELENEKTNTVNDLFNSLKVVTQFLGFSVTIHPQIFSKPSDTHVILTPSLEIIFLFSNGKSEVTRLDRLSPDVVSQCLDYLIPQLVEMIKREKSSLTEKMTFLRSATKRIQQIHRLANNNQSQEPESDKDLTQFSENN